MKLASTNSDGWELADGEVLHKAAPETFYIPPQTVRNSLSVGQTVKLVFRIAITEAAGTSTEEVERMWVFIQEILENGQYLGELHNDPYCTDGIQAGMTVIFEPRHVIQVYEGAA